MKNVKTGFPYKLGVALSGGGARGFAHLGALQAMEEYDLLPEAIAGTSAGALAGAFYADGYSPQEIYNIFKKVKITEVIATTLPQEGFFKTTGLQNILKRHLRAQTFEELKLPLFVAASDIESGKARIFSEGELVPAVIASCSIPIVFTPMEIEGHHYVDGGLFINFPVSVIRKECLQVVGIDVSPVIPVKYDKSMKYIIERTMNYMVGANTVEEMKLCDHLIASDEISSYSIFDLKYSEEIYEKGYEMAIAYLEQHKGNLTKNLNEIPKPKSLHHKVKSLIYSLRIKK